MDVDNPGPLAGVRVLDLTAVVMGPLATQILGDLGADVISVENRQGDINRVMSAGPVRGLSGVALNLLRNKRNIAVDLGHPDGRAALLRVAAGCDVFVTNLRPGSLARLGLEYSDICQVRPDVIFCQACGYPSDGPDADEPAFDDIIQAASGVPDVLGRAGLTPGLIPTLLADKVSGLVVAYSIMAALFHRERTGQGQRIEIPMTDAIRSFVLVEHGGAAICEPPQGPAGYNRILTPLRGALQTADGWIAVQPHHEAHWTALLQAAGLPDLVGDPRLTSRGVWLNPGFAYATLGRVLAAKTTDAVAGLLLPAPDPGRAGGRPRRPHRRASAGGAPGGRELPADPVAGPLLGHPRVGPPARAAARAAHPRGAGRGRPDRRRDHRAGAGGPAAPGGAAAPRARRGRAGELVPGRRASVRRGTPARPG